MGLRGILLANEGKKSGTEDLSSAFKLIPLHLWSTFLVLIFFTHMERSMMLQIYFTFLSERCERLPYRLNEDNMEKTRIVISSKNWGTVQCGGGKKNTWSL